MSVHDENNATVYRCLHCGKYFRKDGYHESTSQIHIGGHCKNMKTENQSKKSAIEIIDLLECLGFTTEIMVDEIVLANEITKIIEKNLQKKEIVTTDDIMNDRF